MLSKLISCAASEAECAPDRAELGGDALLAGVRESGEAERC